MAAKNPYYYLCSFLQPALYPNKAPKITHKRKKNDMDEDKLIGQTMNK